MLPPHYIKII